MAENTEADIITDEEGSDQQHTSNNSFNFQQPAPPINLPEKLEISEKEKETPKEEKTVEEKEIMEKKKPQNISKKPVKQPENKPVTKQEKEVQIENNDKESNSKNEASTTEDIQEKTQNKPSSVTKRVFMDAGTSIIIRLEEKISSQTAHEGKRVQLAIDRDIWMNGGLVVGSGHRLSGQITDVKPAIGSKKGRIELVIERINTPNGETIPLTASTFRVVGKKGEDISFPIGQTFEVKTAQGMELLAKFKK
jgi:type IV secretory pathway VirB10-like protein